MPRNQIEPMPPVADGIGLPWDVPVADAVAEIAEARAAYGDTFVVNSGRDRYLFTFTPTGVESFYALPEAAASKGVADYLMLRRKLPDEIFDGRRTLPGTLFRKGDVASYLANLDHALDAEVEAMGDSGSVDVFELSRRLGHRMGLASWAGPGAADGETFEALVRAFDALDGADSFVHPDAMQAVADSELRRRARGAGADRRPAGRRRREGGTGAVPPDLLGVGRRARGRADVRASRHDVALIHIASMSNLASALGWAVVDLIENPAALARVRDGDQRVRRPVRAGVRTAGAALDHGPHGHVTGDLRRR